MELGHRIAELRKKNKISQTDFAKQYHVTQQTVSSWEHYGFTIKTDPGLTLRIDPPWW